MIDIFHSTVLVVDDEPQSERLLVRMLSTGGFGRVLSTSASADVVQLCERERPDFLVLDLAMPEPNGFALLEALTELIRGEPPLRVAILTGHEHPTIVQRALELGACGVVSKTLPRAELVARLEQAFSSPPSDRPIGFTTGRDLHDARIVTIDDSEINLHVIRRSLERAGFRRVDAFTDPQAAIASCATDGADLVLLDLSMPGIDGFEVLERLTEGPSADAVPVVVLSGCVTDEIHEHATALGAFGVLEKSVIGSNFAERIAGMLVEAATTNGTEG